MQHMHGIIPKLFACWADPVAHLLLQKSSMVHLVVLKQGLQIVQFRFHHFAFERILNDIAVIRKVHIFCMEGAFAGPVVDQLLVVVVLLCHVALDDVVQRVAAVA